MINYRYLLTYFFFLVLFSCSARKQGISEKSARISSDIGSAKLSTQILRSVPKEKRLSPTIQALLSTSFDYIGTPYRFGGTESSGMDCSGFVFKSFEKIGKNIPRISRDQGKIGKEINLEQLNIGDLLFFATGGGKRINHVGIVHDILPSGEIKFIHSSTSKGVIISSLDEKYWSTTYLFARRVFDI